MATPLASTSEEWTCFGSEEERKWKAGTWVWQRSNGMRLYVCSSKVRECGLFSAVEIPTYARIGRVWGEVVWKSDSKHDCISKAMKTDSKRCLVLRDASQWCAVHLTKCMFGWMQRVEAARTNVHITEDGWVESKGVGIAAGEELLMGPLMEPLTDHRGL